MSEARKVQQVLKELRERTRPPLSMRDMAALLGVPHTTYQYYESPKYKKDHLPIHLYEPIMRILRERGVPETEVGRLLETLPSVVRERLAMADVLREVRELRAKIEERP